MNGFYDPARDYGLQPRYRNGTETPLWITRQKIDVQILAPVANEVLNFGRKSGQRSVYGVNHIVDLASLSKDARTRVLTAYDPILTGEDRLSNKSVLQVRLLIFLHVRITDPSGAQMTIRVPGAETRGHHLSGLAQTLLAPKDVSIRSLRAEAKEVLQTLIASGEKIRCGIKLMAMTPTPSELEECSLTITKDASVSIRYDTRSFTFPVSLVSKS